MKGYKAYAFLAVLVFMISPIIVGIIVSISGFKWLTTEDNEWIGFFGSYLGSIAGAAIGGYIAYKIASIGFRLKNQRFNIRSL